MLFCAKDPNVVNSLIAQMCNFIIDVEEWVDFFVWIVQQQAFKINDLTENLQVQLFHCLAELTFKGCKAKVQSKEINQRKKGNYSLSLTFNNYQ